MKTTLAKNVKATDRAWLLVDAKDPEGADRDAHRRLAAQYLMVTAP